MIVERKDLFSHYGSSRENGRPSLGSSRYLKRVKEGNPAPGVQASCFASLTIGYHRYGIGAFTLQSGLKRIDSFAAGGFIGIRIQRMDLLPGSRADDKQED